MKTTTNIIRKAILAAIICIASVATAQTVYKGLRVPQLTTEERTNIGAESIGTPAAGQQVFNLSSKQMEYFDGTKWVTVTSEDDVLNVASDDQTVTVSGSGTSDIDLSVNVKTVANKLSKEISTTILGDSILSYIVQNIDNKDYNIGETVQNYINNHFSEELGSTIQNYINNNFSEDLGKNVLAYITDNVTQELTNNIMAKVKIASKDNSVKVDGSGTSNIDLSVDITTVGNSLVNDNTFVTNMGGKLVSNETFVTNMGDELVTNNQFMKNITNVLYDDTYLKQLIDSLAEAIKNGGDTDGLIQQIVNQITNSNTYIEQLGDKIQNYITNNFSKELGDKILNYITLNADENLTNSIMKYVEVTGTRGIQISGSGTRSIGITLPDASANDDVLTWNGSAWAAKAISSITTSGTVTSVTSNVSGLTFGANSTTTPTLAVTGGAAGQFLASDGTWQTPANDNTTYTGSTSVTLNGTSFERAALTGDVTAAQNDNALTIATGAVTTAKLADNAVTVAKLPAGASASTFLRGDGTWVVPENDNTIYNGSTSVILNGTGFERAALTGDVTAAQNSNDLTIGAGKVTTEKIADNAVTTAKINDNAVTSAKIADKNVTLAKIADGTSAGQIIQWDGSKWELASAASVVKKLEVTVDDSYTILSSNYIGETGATAKTIEVVGIEPVITSASGDRFIARNLTVSVTAKVVSGKIAYTLRIKNDNIDNSQSFKIEKLNIFYTCDEALAAGSKPIAETYAGQ